MRFYTVMPHLLAFIAAALVLGGCAVDDTASRAERSSRTELDAATRTKAPVVVPAQISEALQPPEPAVASPAEARFDLVVLNAQAREVFMGMVADTRYSMLMHPDISGTMSVTLRGVTVREALEAIRDVYGYDFKLEGRRITVYPPSLQTRIFTVNYLNVQREGRSEVRVSSGATPLVPGASTGNTSQPGSAQTSRAQENSRLATSSNTDFWKELIESLRGIVGSKEGRTVVVNPQSGIVAVRAMPDELRHVEAYLKATRVAIERQVMLEAKIVEVQLRDGFQSGIDWTLLRGRNRLGVNSIGPSAGSLGAQRLPSLSSTTPQPGLDDATSFPSAANGLFGLAINATNFAGVLGFLETQGDTRILSSPRVAAMNNQKAVLKVGADELFLTNISGGSTATGSTTTNNAVVTNLPTLSLSSFFSGIALDVMPQIDQSDVVTLHVHPSVSTVAEVTKQFELGGSIGTIKLPLPVNSTNETDTVVRVTDGNIVAIGGLMQLESNSSKSGFPGTTKLPVISNLFGNQAKTGMKREIVVLIKPTIIRSAEDWREGARQSLDRVEDGLAQRRTITIQGSGGTQVAPTQK